MEGEKIVKRRWKRNGKQLKRLPIGPSCAVRTRLRPQPHRDVTALCSTLPLRIPGSPRTTVPIDLSAPPHPFPAIAADYPYPCSRPSPRPKSLLIGPRPAAAQGFRGLGFGAAGAGWCRTGCCPMWRRG